MAPPKKQRYIVDPATECWEWQLSKYPNGYGRFWVKHKEVRSAHRTAYEDEYGPIPQGYVVHHVCRKVNNKRRVVAR